MKSTENMIRPEPETMLDDTIDMCERWAHQPADYGADLTTNGIINCIDEARYAPEFDSVVEYDLAKAEKYDRQGTAALDDGIPIPALLDFRVAFMFAPSAERAKRLAGVLERLHHPVAATGALVKATRLTR